MATPEVMPMFPLGAVLLPGAGLPLHVFEPRYRQMMADCLAGRGEFGVVLITRGREVGGGDERAMVATVARIFQHERFDDGRMAVVSAGVRRIRIVEWLPDAPYPRALVEDWPDEPAPGEPTALPEATAPYGRHGEASEEVAFRQIERRVRTLLAMAAEAGQAVAPADSEIAEEPAVGSFHLAALAPLGPLDQLRVLSARGVTQRLAVLAECLADAEAVIRFRLGLSADED